MTVANISQTNKSSAPCPRRLLLISVPRTASNLLLKILNISNQPNVHTSPKSGYFFYPAFMTVAHGGYLAKLPQDWTDEDKNTVKNVFQECLRALEECSTQAQKENKVMFAKEHAFWMINPASQYGNMTGHRDDELSKALQIDTPDVYGATRTYSPTNETVLSDEYLRSWQLAFVIRHPALAWPSMYRAMQKMALQGFIDEDGIKGASLTNMTLRWTRMLYDWSLDQPDVPAPPIVDAHDLIHMPQVVLKLCEQTGLDPSAVQYEWNPKNDRKISDSWTSHRPDADAEETKWHMRAASIMMATLEASNGIVRDKAPENIDIAVEIAKWKTEFGDEAALLIEKAVWDSMPDYEYLKARRLSI